MKAKALLTAVLLTATTFASASGGLSIGNVEQSMNANNWVATDTARAEIVAQGPIDQFEVVTPDRNRTLVDINQLKQSYDGQV